MTSIEQADDFIGHSILGRYRIVHRLAAGGMGVIYLARNEGAKGFVKPVVVKRILPSLVGDEHSVGLFAREARIMSNLRHPGIVSILDFAEEDAAYLMVLEYVHGFHFGKWQRFLRKTARRVPTDLAVHIAISVLDALHYAHTLVGPDGESLNIVHRDVSPSNVLLDVDGRVMLTDFGIARMRTDHTGSEDKSKLKGTFSYIAPEILRLGDPSPRSDLYSCAVVLHEALVGKNEFWAGDLPATAWRVLDHIPSPVDQLSPDIPPGLGDVLRKALSKNPADRFASALEFAQALRRVRRLAAEDAARKLAETVHLDFHAPEMAAALGMTDLATLGRKWREPPPPPSAPPTLAPPARPPTIATPTAAMIATHRPPPRRQVNRKGLVLGAVGAVVAAAAIPTLLLSRTQPDPAPAVILVEGSVAAVGMPTSEPRFGPSALPAETVSPSATLEHVEPTPVPTSSGTITSASHPHVAGPSGSKSKVEALTHAFAKQQPRIARCFTQNATDVSGSPEIAVRFEVGADGRVLSTEVQPKSLSTTPLGACITQVARTTEFGRQPEPVSFRIPITARRKP